jgi:hypothetical protein
MLEETAIKPKTANLNWWPTVTGEAAFSTESQLLCFVREFLVETV